MTISSASAVNSTRGTSNSANVSIEDFLKILTAQLNNQDPLKPVDNQEFVAQIAQFANLEQTRQLNEKLDGMLSNQASTQALGLLGKTVDINVNGAPFSGTVSALSLASGQPLMTVTSGARSQSNINLSQIINIR
ncbi:MAG TPA: flagellar hook capping FlgD N-terminal domain-containing protein [Pseudoduganella sp.]|jgi:flagellar basal-body rod modification protein FlgD